MLGLKKEVYMSLSQADAQKKLNILRSNGINCDYRIKRSSASANISRGAGVGRYGQETSQEELHYIYVKKTDYERAKELIR